MTAGRIIAITTDTYGDSLATATVATDVSLTVVDATDFDDADALAGETGWLVIGDSDPIAYIDADDDTNTVTLAGTVGAVYEAGLPVTVWDPTVMPTGAPVVEYLASVDTDHGVHPGVVIPHEKIPTSGAENLIGASVGLAEDDSGEWVVSDVYGREAVVDQSVIATPVVSLDLAANQSIAHATTTTISGWEAAVGTNGGYFGDPMPDVTFDADSVSLTVPGAYLAVVTIDWALNTSGSRQATLGMYRSGVLIDDTKVSYSPVDSGESRLQVVRVFVSQGNEEIRVSARQGSGGALIVQSALTNLQIARFAA